jgi:hypothetical protein
VHGEYGGSISTHGTHSHRVVACLDVLVQDGVFAYRCGLVESKAPTG